MIHFICQSPPNIYQSQYLIILFIAPSICFTNYHLSMCSFNRPSIHSSIDPPIWHPFIHPASTHPLPIIEFRSPCRCFQDWLNVQLLGTELLQSSLTAGADWLNQMARAARDQNMTIQYCMSQSRHALHSVSLPEVTQVMTDLDRQINFPNMMKGMVEGWRLSIESWLSICNLISIHVVWVLAPVCTRLI
jgi:hypothetical protein